MLSSDASAADSELRRSWGSRSAGRLRELARLMHSGLGLPIPSSISRLNWSFGEPHFRPRVEYHASSIPRVPPCYLPVLVRNKQKLTAPFLCDPSSTPKTLPTPQINFIFPTRVHCHISPNADPHASSLPMKILICILQHISQSHPRLGPSSAPFETSMGCHAGSGLYRWEK